MTQTILSDAFLNPVPASQVQVAVAGVTQPLVTWLAGGGGGGSTIPHRSVAGATDAPTTADQYGLIDYTSATAVAVTANDLGAGVSYSMHQVGAGVVTVSPGASVTLRYQGNTVATLVSAYPGAVITVICNGNGTVDLKGNA